MLAGGTAKIEVPSAKVRGGAYDSSLEIESKSNEAGKREREREREKREIEDEERKKEEHEEKGRQTIGEKMLIDLVAVYLHGKGGCRCE